MDDGRRFYSKFRSPIPPHLSPEEREEWEEELSWQREEIKRRKKEGFYLKETKENFISRIIRKIKPN